MHGLKLAYDSVPVLDGTAFNVPRGGLVALLGANGAGKSTLLRCMSRVIRPTLGEILLDGRDLRSLAHREAARMLAVVPQETAADFDFTVEEIVAMGRFPYLGRFGREGWADREAVRRAMAMTGVASLAHRSVTTLSGGEKQRVIIARAFAQEPEVLLLDEPTASLDIGYQALLLELAVRLNRERGVTIVAAIHDINLAVQHFTSFILLAGGRVLAAGRAEEVVTAENIREAYGITAVTYRHPLQGVLQVGVVNPGEGRGGSAEGIRIHVIGGGEEALPALEYLRQKGARLSLGPLSEQDSGCRFARFHGLPVVIVPPFTPMQEKHRQEHLRLLRESAAVIIPPIPFGVGNLPLLDEVFLAREEDRPVYIIDLPGCPARDYSCGRATAILEKLTRAGAVSLKDTAELACLFPGEKGGSYA